MSFSRTADRWLMEWLSRPRRKPLILRGARQTGKTTAVRRLGHSVPLFLELNLERIDDLELIRTCHSPAELIERLQQKHGLATVPAGALLFLDEVQEHPEALAWLRFFHENHKDLAVIASGSLLEVRLRKETQPFPVGRVEFLRLEPLTYLESLRATGDDRLADDLCSVFADRVPIPEGLHLLASQRFRDYLCVGGLPEAVDVWRESRNLVEVRRVHDALRQAYAEDLLKYGVRGNTRPLELALAHAPAHFGARFKVRGFVPGEKDRPLREALNLLEQAMVLFRARPTSSRTPPLLPRTRAAHKLLPLDIGLALCQLEVRPEHLAKSPIESLMNGRLAEAFVGIQLLAAHPERPRSLSFWTREGSAKSNAEVDFLVPTAAGILPVEVKSGAAGSLKSLHRFLDGSENPRGVRLSSSAGGLEDLQVDLGGRRILEYELRSLPLYLAELLC